MERKRIYRVRSGYLPIQLKVEFHRANPLRGILQGEPIFQL